MFFPRIRYHEFEEAVLRTSTKGFEAQKVELSAKIVDSIKQGRSAEHPAAVTVQLLTSLGNLSRRGSDLLHFILQFKETSHNEITLTYDNDFTGTG